MPKTVHIKAAHGSSLDPLDAQISIKVKKPKGIRVTKNLLKAAIDAKLNDRRLHDPKGFELRIVWWRNPARLGGHLSDEYKSATAAAGKKGKRMYGDDFERWETLRVPLLSADMVIR